MPKQENLPADGMEEPTKTAVGFGGKHINRLLEVDGDNELYLLLHCEVGSDGRKELKDGTMSHRAGLRTTILAELTASEATKIASGASLPIPVDAEDMGSKEPEKDDEG